MSLLRGLLLTAFGLGLAVAPYHAMDRVDERRWCVKDRLVVMATEAGVSDGRPYCLDGGSAGPSAFGHVGALMSALG